MFRKKNPAVTSDPSHRKARRKTVRRTSITTFAATTVGYYAYGRWAEKKGRLIVNPKNTEATENA